MKQVFISFSLIALMSMVGVKAYAYDIAVKNTNGVAIYYNYINDAKDLEVASGGNYQGTLVIPEEVTYLNRMRKVTAIGAKAFYQNDHLTSITIPNSVTTIGEYAFSGCTGLASVTIPNNVTTIEKEAFWGCSDIKTVTIPNNVTTIGDAAFAYCKSLTSVTIPNKVTIIEYAMFEGCSSLTSVTIPNSVNTIGAFAFSNCHGLASITIPNSVTSIGNDAFAGCSGLTSVTIPNSVKTIGIGGFEHCSGLTSVTFYNGVTTIGERAFEDCSSLTSITIPNSVTSIGDRAFMNDDLSVVISLIENPFRISDETFNNNTTKNATLYVPVGTIEKYISTDGWKDFLFIEEGTGGGSTTTPKKCEKPTISYSNGKLKFTSGTEGASCQYNITDTDIKSGSGNEVQLTVTYSISAYATKAGYDNSETVTATLCWIDVNPKTEGIGTSIANVRANPVLIQSNGGVLNISGINDGADIVVYSASGQMVGSSKAMGNQASVFTNMKKGEIAIVKIGDKSVKVAIQ
jgi:Flp pilus assembly protein protease CpaA